MHICKAYVLRQDSLINKKQDNIINLFYTPLDMFNINKYIKLIFAIFKLNKTVHIFAVQKLIARRIPQDFFYK